MEAAGRFLGLPSNLTAWKRITKDSWRGGVRQSHRRGASMMDRTKAALDEFFAQSVRDLLHLLRRKCPMGRLSDEALLDWKLLT